MPSPTALAATWDEQRIERLGRLLAAEARRKGVDVLLAPNVNLHRTPYGGRHFECLSEDPVLTGRIGAAYVRGLQSEGVRLTVDVAVDERALHELYLAPFETIVREGGVWSVMAAYNGVNGHPMTDGLTMTDWYAGRSLATTAAGLDLIMPGPHGPWGDALIAAVRSGEVDESIVDDKVLRLLRLAARVGALHGISGSQTRPWTPEQIAARSARPRQPDSSLPATFHRPATDNRSCHSTCPGCAASLCWAPTPRLPGPWAAAVRPSSRPTPSRRSTVSDVRRSG